METNAPLAVTEEVILNSTPLIETETEAEVEVAVDTPVLHPTIQAQKEAIDALYAEYKSQEVRDPKLYAETLERANYLHEYNTKVFRDFTLVDWVLAFSDAL